MAMDDKSKNEGTERPEVEIISEGEMEELSKGYGNVITIDQQTGDLSNYLVAQSNKLVTASYKLSLQENRLILLAISKLDSRKIGSHPDKRIDQSTVAITAKEFSETFGVNSKKVYEELQEATNNLFERKINEIDGKKTTKMRWVSKIVYHEGEGWVELTFSQDVLPHLTLLRNNFTTFKLISVTGLKSTYSQRIRAMCNMFIDTGMLRIGLEDFRKSLMLPYKDYSNIRRRVLEPAIKEINAMSDISIVCYAIKRGRAVATLEFHISKNPQRTLDLEEDQEVAMDLALTTHEQ